MDPDAVAILLTESCSHFIDDFAHEKVLAIRVGTVKERRRDPHLIGDLDGHDLARGFDFKSSSHGSLRLCTWYIGTAGEQHCQLESHRLAPDVPPVVSERGVEPRGLVQHAAQER